VPDSGQKRWVVLSLVLAIALGTLLGFALYSGFYVSQESSETVDLAFSWGPERQRIVNGTFRLEVSMNITGENMTMVIRANDDDYDEYDYLGLVFDTNGNGLIDHGDEPYGLYANNLTGPTILTDYGFLGWAQVRPIRGPQNVTFSPDAGYTFVVQFPFFHPGSLTDQPWFDPASTIRRGVDNPLHICFHDDSYYCAAAHSSGVFARFAFYVPTENET
jgi:hypothetical protein